MMEEREILNCYVTPFTTEIALTDREIDPAAIVTMIYDSAADNDNPSRDRVIMILEHLLVHFRNEPL